MNGHNNQDASKPSNATRSHERGLRLDQMTSVHFIGIGGVGMSALAFLLKAHGISVSGSDAAPSPVLDELTQAGVRVVVGHDQDHLADATTVVHSTAIRENNPELMAARAKGLSVVHRSEILAALMKDHLTVAVTGTHGKTTTTAMAVVALEAADVDPSYVVGAQVPELGGSSRRGQAPVFIAEADESDASFFTYRPTIAVLTNAEPDHLDFYGSAEAVMGAFEEFAGLLPRTGVLIACVDDPGAARVADALEAKPKSPRIIRYGRGQTADFRLSGPLEALQLTLPKGTVTVDLPALTMPGEHNALNAVAALALVEELVPGSLREDVKSGTICSALAQFRGAVRRFELKAETRGVRVYDDYAHHPTEVQAALTAARGLLASSAGDGRLFVLFQPHLFSRTREFAAEFAWALGIADRAWVLNIYPAREDPIPGVSSALILAAAPGGSLELAEDPEDAVQSIVKEVHDGDIVLVMGAGDVTAWGERLTTLLKEAPAG